MKARHVKLTDFDIGKPLPDNLYDDSGQLMLHRGYVVTDSDIKRIQKGIVILFNDKTRRLEEERGEEELNITHIKDTPFDILKMIQFHISGLLKSIAEGKDIMTRTRNLSRNLVEVCTIDEDMALGMILLERENLYTIRHPIHTGIVCEIMSKKMGWDLHDRISLVSAALTMNVSILQLQEELHYQRGPLNEKQQEEIFRHPETAMLMLKASGVTDELWLDTVLQHHELKDGSGYPGGMEGEDISFPARILSLADVYCARVSGRDYRQPLSPLVALKEIFMDKDHKLETELALIFIKTLGLFPPGTFVRLKNNETAVVTHRGEKTFNPIVHTVLKSNDFPPVNPLRRDTSIDEFSIVDVIPQSKVRVDVNRHQLWGYGVFRKTKTAKRRNIRVKTEVPAKILDLDNIRTYDARILNLSTGGALVQIPYKIVKFDIGQILYVTFKIMDRTYENIRCMIKNVNQVDVFYLYGMEFLEITEELRTIIKDYIDRR